MSQMMDTSTEGPSKDAKSNGSIKSDEKMTTDGGTNGGFMQKLRKSFRRVKGMSLLSRDKGSKVTPQSDTAANESVSVASPPPPSPSLSANSPTDSLRNIEKKEDDQNVSTLGQSLRRVRQSFRQSMRIYPKKNNSMDMSISEDPEDRVNPTFEEYLERQCFCEATQLLIDREKHLFGEVTEADVLEAQKEEVEKLAADHEALEKHVQQTLGQSLSEDINSEEGVSALMSAVKAITLEEEQDQLWKQRCQTPPTWRPKKWKEHHDSMLRELVNYRMDNPSILVGDQVKQSSVQKDISSMGRQLKDDLLLVVTVVKICYPPEMDICNFYARLYHQTFSSRLRKLADKDHTLLLQWVNDFYPGILQEPELANNINTDALGKLLPDDLLEPLEEQYLSKQQSDLMIFIDRALDVAKEEWDQGKEPTRDDGCCISPVACDVIQFINGKVTSAQKIVGDQDKAQKIIPHLTDFMQSYKDFHEDTIKQNRPHSKALIKANLGCVKQFRDFFTTESDLFPEDVRESYLQVLTEMKQSAHTYLLNPVHKVLKPHYQKLGTSEWLKNNALFEKLLLTLDEELQQLQGSTQSCHQELIGQLHQKVTEEYVQKLLRGEVKLKDSDRQQKAYMTVNENAERLHELFTRMGSKQEWLKEILTKIAEVLKLQDIPAIQMQIVSLGSAYPDLSEKHILALLKLKTTLTKADKKTIKTTVLDILNESRADAETRMFFSNVEVR
ncbi:tumor necrosis factor alpha-induced protein 2-like [Archocentrus centrarchus]|uniref:tumor necrosis factor alpha-induced protein 2-like n=1 Tax=Archocentrus centrarchus TaxID=63155 RepID=UPI0011EA10E8|nr:tumor necrosis factor alpha-induced protein 2-like [Archocentrus centrarchus]XP_030574336.1 tumor necrosis factor alpha-induced protein 2-like [Archocentrus centrarchus]XP_030574337.1 tumor necrosis factor alpha-induced protein 2-like [Archocentrus centrarchus]